jgi:hypothetical protein
MTTASVDSDVTKPIPCILQNLLKQLKEADVNNDSMQMPYSQPWQKLFWMRLRQLITSSNGKLEINLGLRKSTYNDIITDSRLADNYKICEEELRKLQATFENEQTISLTKQDSSKYDKYLMRLCFQYLFLF